MNNVWYNAWHILISSPSCLIKDAFKVLLHWVIMYYGMELSVAQKPDNKSGDEREGKGIIS